jgi:hypothetical protein
MKANGLLRTYLQDHHAGATAGLELARRAASANEDHASGPELARIADEIEADREVLEQVMKAVGVGPSSAKDAAAWTAEKLGRLKPNNRLVGYSPLSRVVELEGLVLGVSGKLALWEALQTAIGPGVEDADFAALAARAEDQRERLDALRREAAREALGLEG